MDKTEALDFIGLKEPLTEDTLRSRYNERFNYFRMLYANASTKVIEKIQQQNLEKLKQAKKVLLEEIAAKRKQFDETPSSVVMKPKPDAIDPAKKPVVAWLIVHTENKKAEMFDLYEGINYIGRKKWDDKANNILIADDPFVSRTHAFIKCKETDGKLQYMLHDGDGSKPSVNGVFLNGNDTRIQQYCLLKEGDTIQIGITKLVFKERKAHRNISGELEEVLRTDYIRTIDVYK